MFKLCVVAQQGPLKLAHARARLYKCLTDLFQAPLKALAFLCLFTTKDKGHTVHRGFALSLSFSPCVIYSHTLTFQTMDLKDVLWNASALSRRIKFVWNVVLVKGITIVSEYNECMWGQCDMGRNHWKKAQDIMYNTHTICQSGIFLSM